MSADPRVSTEAAVARLDARMEGIGREIGQMRRDTADDLARIEAAVTARLERIETQTVATNGRVTRHDQELDRMQTREQVRAELLAEERSRQDRRMRTLQWVVGVALAVLIAAVGWLITIVG